ncbi:MAG: WG repeat-containing protein, partial [Phormidesmis sp. CAN_BIN44]|nr:WG repeat-containing protein [Phormidesmis sp. CAN_BIN44]
MSICLWQRTIPAIVLLAVLIPSSQSLKALPKQITQSNPQPSAKPITNLAIEHQFDSASNFSEGFALVRIGDQFRYIDRMGKVVVIPQVEFESYSPFSEGLAIARVGSNYGYIDKTGDVVINPRFEGASQFLEGLAAIRIGNHYGFINSQGKVIINPEFELAS